MVDRWLRVMLAIRITLPGGLWSIRSLMWRMMRYCSSSVPVGSLKVAPVVGSKVSAGGATSAVADALTWLRTGDVEVGRPTGAAASAVPARRSVADTAPHPTTRALLSPLRSSCVSTHTPEDWPQTSTAVVDVEMPTPGKFL